MIRLIKIVCVLSLASILLQSCSAIYNPSTVVPNNFEDKKQMNMCGTVATTGLYGNMAYSPIKNTFVHVEGGKSVFRSTYNISAGVGFYYDINEKVQIESQLGYGEGEFDWGDPFNGSSFSFTYARGDLNYYTATASVTIKRPKNTYLTIAYRHSHIDLHYKSASFDQNNVRFNIQQGGIHFVLQKRLSDRFNNIIAVGLEGHNAAENTYTTAGLYSRVGFQYKIGKIQKSIINNN